jgi:hypothetical protein
VTVLTTVFVLPPQAATAIAAAPASKPVVTDCGDGMRPPQVPG